jgi:hypothetical protein
VVQGDGPRSPKLAQAARPHSVLQILLVSVSKQSPWANPQRFGDLDSSISVKIHTVGISLHEILSCDILCWFFDERASTAMHSAALNCRPKRKQRGHRSLDC